MSVYLASYDRTPHTSPISCTELSPRRHALSEKPSAPLRVGTGSKESVGKISEKGKVRFVKDEPHLSQRVFTEQAGAQ